MSEVKLRNFHAAKWNEPLLMEMSVPGSRGILPPLPAKEICDEIGPAKELIPAALRRKEKVNLPEVDQYHVLQHFLRLSQETMGMALAMDIGEGTCTMKYSPSVHDQMAEQHQAGGCSPVVNLMNIFRGVWN